MVVPKTISAGVHRKSCFTVTRIDKISSKFSAQSFKLFLAAYAVFNYETSSPYHLSMDGMLCLDMAYA